MGIAPHGHRVDAWQRCPEVLAPFHAGAEPSDAVRWEDHTRSLRDRLRTLAGSGPAPSVVGRTSAPQHARS